MFTVAVWLAGGVEVIYTVSDSDDEVECLGTTPAPKKSRLDVDDGELV
jgi:hypothetical protein